MQQSSSNQNLDDKFNNYDRYENHPSTRLRDQPNYSTTNATLPSSKDFSARLDANLQEMCSDLSRLKGLANDLNYEITTQNELIDDITEKTDRADMMITRQNKDMKKILKK